MISDEKDDGILLEILGETGRAFMGVIAIFLTFLYIISPFDLPTPIDDFIVLLLGAFVARWSFFSSKKK